MRNGIIWKIINWAPAYPLIREATMMLTHLAEAVNLAARLNHLFVATVNGDGIPHLAIAERIILEGEDQVAVTAWFCPKTAGNVAENGNISLVVWDRDQDTGFQLVGNVEKMLDLAMMDGFLPEEQDSLPQIERKLVIRVQHVLRFSHTHHNDTDLD